MGLVSVREVCQPREEVLAGKSSMDIYAAKLNQVVQGKAPEVYQDAARFFENTYPTEGLKTTVREVFGRLSQAAVGSPVIKLETSLGGGKTHTLIALYHLAKLGSKAAPPKIVGDLAFPSMRVVAIVGTDPSIVPEKGQPATLWGEIGRQLGRYQDVRAADEARVAPGAEVLDRMLGNEKALLLIDETALYLTKASGVEVAGSTLAKQTVVFFQELTEVVSSKDNVCLVITSLDRSTVFAEQTELLESVLDRDVQRDRAARAVEEANEVVSRVVRNLTPTRSEEFPNVVRHRLFKSYNRTAGVEVCKQYHSSLRSDGVRESVPRSATEAKYLEYLQESYPFHPELMSILRNKTSSITQFNQTRGVLRLLGLLVKHVWDKHIDTPLIHPHHIDFRVQGFREELISRLDQGQYKAAVTQDIADERGTPRASLVDEEFSQPLGTWLATTAFLHSLTAIGGRELQRGANEAELQLALHEPGLDPRAVERALRSLEDKCFYLVKHGTSYSFNTEPNLNQVIERAKGMVEGAQVLREIETRVSQVYGGQKFFRPCVFANEPSKVPDDTEKPKLVVVHWHEATTRGSMKEPELVIRIFHESGTQGKPRIFANNLVFLLVDDEEKEAMEVKAREFLALKNLHKDIEENAPSVSVLSPAQRAKIKEKRNEAELYLKVAIVVAHKHLFVPTTQKDLESSQGRRPLRKLTTRVTDTEVKERQRANASDEEYLVEFLHDQRAARTVDDEPLAPDFVLDRLWPKNTASLTGDEFKKAFYKNPAADLIFSPELVTKAQQAGVREGKWYGILGPQFFDKTNAATFSGAFAAELRLVLADTEEGRTAWQQFNCPTCKRRRTQCVCAKPDVETPPEPGPQPLPPSPRGALRVEGRTMGGISEGLKVLMEDRDVEQIAALELQPKGRSDLARLALALPQFHGADIRFDLEAVLNREHAGGNFLRTQYKGDLKGFQDLKAVLINYEAKESFSMSTLRVMLKWPDGLDAIAFLALMNKVANFTGESIFTAIATPKSKDAAKGGTA